MNKSTATIVSMEDVLRIESKSAVVWVMAPDIALGPQQFKDVMIDNLRTRGVKYRYLVSNECTVLENLFEFVKDLTTAGALSGFSLRIISKSIIESDVTIYDPNTSSEAGFILAPYENADQHYRLRGSSLYRIKDRFSTLWNIADPIDLTKELNYPIDSLVTRRSILSYSFDLLAAAPRADNLLVWEKLGHAIANETRSSQTRDTRYFLIQKLVDLYSSDRDICPPFHSLTFPQTVSDSVRILTRDALACHLSGAYSASIGICGKVLETALRYYAESRSDTQLDQNLGLGKLIRHVIDCFDVQLDEGLKVLVNFINQFRITGVHSKKGFEIPTFEQSYSVLYATYDTLHKLFPTE